MIYLFNEFLYRPLLNLLFFIYGEVFSDLGVAIIILTIVIRVVLLPLFYKSAKDQAILQKIAPQIKEVQKLHKDNKERQVKEMMQVYKDHKVSPFSGFLLLLLQLPILIALYKVFLGGFSEETISLLYGFVSHPDVVNYDFLGLVDLKERSLILVALSAFFQYLQSKLMLNLAKGGQKKGNLLPAEKIARQMALFSPIITLVILYPLPAAVALYWLTTSVFSVIQQIVINRRIGARNYGGNEKNP